MYDSFTFEKEGAEGIDYVINSGDWYCREISGFEIIGEASVPIFNYVLFKPYPNPFNAETIISFELRM